jgi:hypothetical protein
MKLSCSHFSKAYFFLIIAKSDASEISTRLAALAASTKLLSMPSSLHNETYVTIQFHKLLMNETTFLTLCIARELGWKRGAEGFFDNEGCEYFEWTLLWSSFGWIMILVLLISCIGFGTGRVYCECCCKTCGCAQCGGNKPTMTYSVARAVTIYTIYFMLLATLLPLLMMGSLVTVEVIYYLTQTSSAVSGALNSLSSLSNRTALKTWELVQKAERHIETMTSRFDQLELVAASSAAFAQALNATLLATRSLAYLVDGCTAADNCDNNSAWNECHYGHHESPSGSAAFLSTGRLNPACFGVNGSFRGCPCCVNCSNAVKLIQSASSNVPLNWTALDRRIPLKEARHALHAAASGTQNSLKNTMLFANEVDRIFQHLKTPALIAANAGGLLFGIGFFVSIVLVLGISMASRKDRGGCRNFGTSGQRLIWAAFVLGIVWVCAVVLPLFAVLSIFSIPLSSTCKALDSGHEESYLRAVLENAVTEYQGPNMAEMIISCLLLNRSVSKYYSNDIDSVFQSLQHPKGQISGSMMKKYFAIEGQTAPFKESRGEFSNF